MVKFAQDLKLGSVIAENVSAMKSEVTMVKLVSVIVYPV